MEVQNVVKGVITSRDAETTYGIASGNKGVIPFLEQYPDRFIGMAGLDPHKGMDAIDELRLMVETHGFRGAAIDRSSPRFRPTTQNIIRSMPSAVNSTFPS